MFRCLSRNFTSSRWLFLTERQPECGTLAHLSDSRSVNAKDGQIPADVPGLWQPNRVVVGYGLDDPAALLELPLW